MTGAVIKVAAAVWPGGIPIDDIGATLDGTGTAPDVDGGGAADDDDDDNSDGDGCIELAIATTAALPPVE